MASDFFIVPRIFCWGTLVWGPFRLFFEDISSLKFGIRLEDTLQNIWVSCLDLKLWQPDASETHQTVCMPFLLFFSQEKGQIANFNEVVWEERSTVCEQKVQVLILYEVPSNF